MEMVTGTTLKWDYGTFYHFTAYNRLAIKVSTKHRSAVGPVCRNTTPDAQDALGLELRLRLGSGKH